MAGIEIAGVVLGGIPIAIWALEKYAEPLETYTNYHIAISTLKANLQLQQWQLEKTLAGIGLHQPTSEELRSCFAEKLPDRQKELLFIIERMEEITAKLLENLDVDMNKRPGWSTEHGERASWEWRKIKRTFGSKKREKYVQQLRAWNEDLRHCVEKSEVPAEDDNRSVQKVRLRFNRAECDSTRQRLEGLHRAVANCTDCGPDDAHETTIDLNWITAKGNTTVVSRSFSMTLSHGLESELVSPDAVPWKRFQASVYDNGQPASDVSLKPTMSTPIMSPSPTRLTSQSTLKPIISAPESSTGSLRGILSRHRSSSSFYKRSGSKSPKFDDSATLVESRRNSAIQPTTPPPPQVAAITNLCHELEKTIANGDSIGLLQDPAQANDMQFTLTTNPRHGSDIVRTYPLKSLLSTQEEDIDLPPLSAKDRYGMAAAIAWGVLHLGGSPWLGDRWDSHQLRVFLEKNPYGDQSLATTPTLAYFMASLSQSPAPDPSSIADAVSLSIPNQTLFLLGILLIELGTNSTFSSATLSNLLTQDSADLRSKLDSVYREAGDSYGYAAQRCVKCDFQGMTNQLQFGIPKFRQQFHDAVVAPVQATYEVFKSSFEVLHL